MIAFMTHQGGDTVLDKRKIRAARKARGLTQEELGKLCDMKKETISRLENGERDNIQLDTLDRLADGLGVKPAELLK